MAYEQETVMLFFSYELKQPIPPLGNGEKAHVVSISQHEDNNEHDSTKCDDRPIPPVKLELIEPGALALTKTTQVHCVGNIFA